MEVEGADISMIEVENEFELLYALYLIHRFLDSPLRASNVSTIQLENKSASRMCGLYSRIVRRLPRLKVVMQA